MSTDCLRPVAILWDIENCAVPHGVDAEDVAVHIRMAVKVQLAMNVPICVFSAYGDFSHLSRRTRQGCQKTGVNLIDIPHGHKDAADKAILVDMFLFALDNPPPCTIVLISGDVDFAPALHKLGQRGYCVVLAIPSGPKVSPALCNACQYLWSWPDIARGKGVTTGSAPFMCTIKDDKPLEKVGLGAKNDCNDEVTVGGPSHNPVRHEALTKIPVGIFEERIKVPFHFAEEMPVAMGMDYKVTGAYGSNRPLFPPSSGMAYPITSYGMAGYDNGLPSTSQGMNGVVPRSKIVPLGGQYVCDWFAAPYPGRAPGAHVAGEEGFGHSQKGLVHQSSADYEHCTNGGWDNHRPGLSPNCTYPNVQGPVTRSENAQKGSAKTEGSKPGKKKAAHAKGQVPSSQLKVKKKKMKKTQDNCAVTTSKLSKKQRKALQAGGTC